MAVSVSIANAGRQALEFAAVIEARDRTGAIVFLAWDNSTLT